MRLLLVPLDDSILFPNMTATVAADVGDEQRVLVLPRNDDGEFAEVGTIAEVIETARVPGAGRVATLGGLHRGVPESAAAPDPDGRLRVEVREVEDSTPAGERTRELEREYRDDVEDGAQAQQREYFLRKQMESIRKELGEDDGDVIGEYESKIEEAGMPEDVHEQAMKELRRLERTGEQSGESSMIRTYLDWLIAVPWSKTSDEKLDPKSAREVLDADHAGLEDVKDRITEYLAVKKLRTERGITEDKKSGAILTLIGPPGTGKTSIGESIARATGREFVRMSLGGVRD